MNPRELRIGNYITPKWSDDTFVIDSIDNRSFIIGYGGTYSSRVEDLKPIPITKDWLLKFGFKYDPPGIGGQDQWSGYGFWEFGDFSLLGNREVKDVVYYNRMAEIKHVHQLQNLYFALTGEELELKNLSLTNRSPANLAGD